jgi:hypothetical protein
MWSADILSPLYSFPRWSVGTHLLDAPRFRGFLDYFPPTRASFSSGIRGVEKTAFAAWSIFSGKTQYFDALTSLRASFRSRNGKWFDEHGRAGLVAGNQ